MGLDCGACSGHSGRPNAEVAAAVLNDGAVRDGLAERGLSIPDDTVFLAGTHNTITDEVTVVNREAVPSEHRALLHDLEDALEEAGRRTRKERAKRFHLPDDAEVDEAVTDRSRDWSQVRPEWGLAGCMSFVIAPRRRTEQLDLEGRSFLHNVVGELGVLEGNAGDLRVGLPWQSVHDGDTYQHEPLRLNVVIEAPREAINDVLDAHDNVRALCDNGWLQLLAMDEGTVTHRYAGDLTWTPVEA
ncbi:MAG: hypothetical protein BRD55_03585 [Bacteroidetes bacterium SW_9_63_38]|nr:MAG: hypothetical protein BRD55_03585 [Bacteroidetes bacterium SW_9_63_38]